MLSSLSGHVQMEPTDNSYNLKQVMAELCLAQFFAVYAALIKGKFFAFEFFVIAFSDVEYFLYACSCSYIPESVLAGSSPVRALLLGLGPDTVLLSDVAM